MNYLSGSQTVGRAPKWGTELLQVGAVRKTSPITKVRLNVYVTALTGCAIATSELRCDSRVAQ